MKYARKLIKAYDLRQLEYERTMKDTRVDPKVDQRIRSNGYKRPGSRQLKKARG